MLYVYDMINRYVLVLIENPTTKYMMVFPSYKNWTNLTEINEYAKRFLQKIDFENRISNVQFGKIEQFEFKFSANNRPWNIYSLNGNDEIVLN